MAIFVGGILILIGIFVCLIALAAVVTTIIGEWKVFEKAGKPGWAAIVPLYNSYVIYQLGGFPPLLMLLNVGVSVLAFISGFFNGFLEYYEEVWAISIIFSGILSLASLALTVVEVLTSINIAKKFGKSELYGFGLAFLPFVFYMMLGLDKKAVYNESIK